LLSIVAVDIVPPLFGLSTHKRVTATINSGAVAPA
jgi:hypothetical protein